jgi:NADH dehydrogenase
MAVVGKNYAVLERGWLRTGGFLTWLVWAWPAEQRPRDKS